MHKIFFLFILVFVFAISFSGCKKEAVTLNKISSSGTVENDVLKNGKKLENPYALKYMKQAFRNLKSRKQLKSQAPLTEEDIVATHLYVRFLPSTAEQADLLLENSGLQLFDHPLDYQLAVGEVYTDPSIPSGQLQWAYTVVPAGYQFPAVTHEILEQCYIPDENAMNTAAVNAFFAELEQEAYIISGNSEMLGGSLKSTAWTSPHQPEGTIRVKNYPNSDYDSVKNVKVRTYNFVKYSTAYTNYKGYYKEPTSFRTQVFYEVYFENGDGFKIWGNMLFFSPAVINFGLKPNSGYSVDFEDGTKGYLWSHINNAAFEYDRRCENTGVLRPPSDLRFWTVPIGHKYTGSTPMGHHSGIGPSTLASFLYGLYGAASSTFMTAVINLVMPDIFILLPNNKERRDIYETVYHECAHASHYSQVGNSYWQIYVSRIIDNSVLYAFNQNVDCYGTGSETNAGYIGVGEIWGNYFGARCEHEKFGDNGKFHYYLDWYNPGFFMELHDLYGFSDQELFSCLSSGINTIPKLRDELHWKFPLRPTQINTLYDKYFP